MDLKFEYVYAVHKCLFVCMRLLIGKKDKPVYVMGDLGWRRYKD